MFLRELFVCVVGISYGLLAAAGVFTVLVAVGLVPRFAGETHTAQYVLLYEEMVIFGTIAGCFCSLFPMQSQLGAYLQHTFAARQPLWDALGKGMLVVVGVFSGMFVGCLALAIAETLDSIPIFTRRISFRKGIGLAVLSMAIGKIAGSFYYFLLSIYRTA